MSPALPPVAAQRLARLGAQSPSSWSADPGSLVVLSGVGFDFVGEVMGCNAATLTAHAGTCGYRSGRASVRLGGGVLRERGALSYPRRAGDAYASVLRRLRDEALARGADGVVSVTPTVTWQEGDLAEIVVTGLGVRARSATRPTQPFLTMADPVELSLLLRSGWVPVDVHAEFQVGVRHDDDVVEQADLTPRSSDLRRANFPLPGLNELIARMQTSVRAKLDTQVRSAGADGAFVRDIAVHTHHDNCTVLLGRTDRVAVASGWASSLARFTHRPADPLDTQLVQELASSQRSRR